MMTGKNDLLRIVGAAILCSALAGCGTGGWFGDDEPPPLPGERISVLQLGRTIEADPRLSDLEVTLPPAERNGAWPQAGGYPNHALGHLALSDSPREVWRVSIGDGSSSTRRLMARPVVAEGRVFTLDTDFDVAAFDEGTGREIWRTDVTPESERGEALGGGVAFADGKLFAATGYGELLALDAAGGGILWRTRVGVPMRAAPTVIDGRVFVVSVDNQAFAYQASDGQQIWTHTGILETASLLGAASPAADGSLVVVPYSSGELFALRVENGRPAWSDSLAAVRRIGALSGLADIRGMPVIDRGLVLAISHSGRMAAIDERSGARAWEQEIGGVEMPWVAGDFIYLLTNEGELTALTRQAGRIRWVTPLDRWEDPQDRTGTIEWAGPVLAGGRLWLANTREELVSVSPADGQVLSTTELPAAAFLAPVVANGTLYVLTDDGTLIAYR